MLLFDPLIANITDKSKNKLGRRVPFMRYSFIPLSVFSALIFLPLFRSPNHFNIYWLAITQVFFYFFYGMYTIPYNALLADMGYDEQAKLSLSTAQSVGFMVGVLVASSSIVVVKVLIDNGITTDRLLAYQIAIVALNIIAIGCLAVPAFFIDEKKYVEKGEGQGRNF